jgi:hypothetical protein
MTRQQSLFNADIEGTAILSPDRAYRYLLVRAWDWDIPHVNFLMLNPSTADETNPDPTMTRCSGFARSWGYGGFRITNLFAFRSSDPTVLATSPDPVGPDNDRHIISAAVGAEVVVCAWGAFAGTSWARRASLTGRAKAVLDLLATAGRKPHYLRLTKSGEPWHPLYLPADLRPIPWEPK